MDLIQSLAMSEALTQTLKYTTRRERPDLSGRNSFPSGHASDTFAFATALERHLGWRYAVPAYVFASYVAVSRLPANRHWFSDAVFGSAVGIIAGRTVTSHEASPFPVAVAYVPGGAAALRPPGAHRREPHQAWQYVFARHGAKVVFLGRFVAVLRALAALLAGINYMGWRRFLFFNASGGVVWAGGYGLAPYVFGSVSSACEVL
jgi:hypothetical protein